ncbi:four helix bundle protein [Shewanella baltica]|uniref:hypothetical protein n=1 Tax=Shewanella baltica TaxID=62322 RepID=UPI002877DDDB|nr:hypothetical protein [Shewanella baltica]
MITQIYIAIEIGVVDKQNGMTLIKEAKEMSAMLASLIKIRKGCVREESADYKIEPRTSNLEPRTFFKSL